MTERPFSRSPTATEIAAYCLARPGAEESHPWGEESLVPKVAGKMFAAISDERVWVKLGSSTEDTEPWRQRFPDHLVVAPYIGRHGWNSISLGGSIEADEVQEMLDISYDLVVAKLPRSRRPG